MTCFMDFTLVPTIADTHSLDVNKFVSVCVCVCVCVCVSYGFCFSGELTISILKMRKQLQILSDVSKTAWPTNVKA